jgi:hypothetical protein
MQFMNEVWINICFIASLHPSHAFFVYCSCRFSCISTNYSIIPVCVLATSGYVWMDTNSWLIAKAKAHYTTQRRSGGEEVQLLLTLDIGTGWGWVFSVTLRPRFKPGKGPPPTGTNWTGGWVGPTAGLDTEARGKILSPLPGIESRSPGRPASSQTELPGSPLANKFTKAHKMRNMLLIRNLSMVNFVSVSFQIT